MKYNVWSILGALSLPITIVGLIYVLHLAFVEMREWQRNHLFQEPQHPFLHLGDNVPINTLHLGEQFFVHVETERKAICTVDIAYHIIQQKLTHDLTERTVFVTFGVTRALSYPGRNITNILLVIPEWLKPGSYILDRTALYNCDRLNIFQSPQIPITILASDIKGVP